MLQSCSVGQTQSPTGRMTTGRMEATDLTVVHRILNPPDWPSGAAPARRTEPFCGRSDAPEAQAAAFRAQRIGLLFAAWSMWLEGAAKAVRRRTATRLGRRRRCSRDRCDRPSRAVTDARLHLDLHVRPLHADRVARDALRRGGLQHGAGLDVVDGPMPRARHLLARHLALTDRAAAVRAGVVDGVEAPLQVEEGDLLPSNFDALRRARREVGSVRDLDELGHMDLLATRREGPTNRCMQV